MRIIFLISLLVFAAPAYANHWRSVAVSSLTAPPSGVSDLRFTLHDRTAIGDAALELDMAFVSYPANAAITCLDAANQTIAALTPSRSYAAAERKTWDVPRACFSAPVHFRITSSVQLSPSFIRLHVRSAYRRAPIETATSPSGGTCTGACAQGMNQDDNTNQNNVACSSGQSFANPTDFTFTVFDRATVADARLELDANGGAGSQIHVGCVDQNGLELAPLGDFTFTNQQIHSANVSSLCFTAPNGTTRIRLTRQSGACLAVDYLGLDVRSAAHEVRPTQAVASGTCQATPTADQCVPGLSRNDDTYNQWQVCSSAWLYGTPTDVHFNVPETSVSAAQLVLDTTASGSNAQIRISCRSSTAELAQILPTTLFPAFHRTHTFSVPSACFGAGPAVIIRFERMASNCLGMDYLRLLTVSAAPGDRSYNNHHVEGYTDAASVIAGEDLTFFIHAPWGSFTGDFYRFGATQEFKDSVFLSGNPQNPRLDSARDGAGWDPTFTYTIPSIWPSGLYGLELSDGSGGLHSWIMFVVKDPMHAAYARIAVIASTNTWTAYNNYGGKSHYEYLPADETRRPYSQRVSRARPNYQANPSSLGGHLAGAEINIIEWLEDNEHFYAMIADEDLDADPTILLGFHTVIINTHGEYWTPKMYDGLEHYLYGGGDLAYLSGNGIYWKSTIEGDELETKKDQSAHEHDSSAGGLWRDVGRPEAAVLGVAYDANGFGTSDPYRVLEPNHFIFAGTNVVLNQTIGSNGRVGSHGIGASGWETDKTVLGTTPANAIVLAEGTNPNNGGADMVYYEHVGGGAVYSVGSINFGRSLVIDSTLTTMVNNAIDSFEKTTRDVAVTAITSSGGTCGASCLSQVVEDDGIFPQWIACSNVYAYANPTDFLFTVRNYSTIESAVLVLDTEASGSDARVEVTCINAAQQTLATIKSATPAFSWGPQKYELNVPLACFDDDDVVIRFSRVGSNCLGPDLARLRVTSPSIAAPLAELGSPAPTCGVQPCLEAINANDGGYSTLACGGQLPNWLSFALPRYTEVATVYVDMELRGMTAPMDARVTCLDTQSAPVQIAPTTTFGTGGQLYSWIVPSSCIYDSRVDVFLEPMQASGCLQIDYARVYGVP